MRIGVVKPWAATCFPCLTQQACSSNLKIVVVLNLKAYASLIASLFSLAQAYHPANATTIRLNCVLANKEMPLVVVVLDTGSKRVWTQGVDGSLHERKLKLLSKEILAFEESSLIDLKPEKLYIESIALYTINRIDGFLQFKHQSRFNQYHEFEIDHETGRCERSEQKNIF